MKILCWLRIALITIGAILIVWAAIQLGCCSKCCTATAVAGACSHGSLLNFANSILLLAIALGISKRCCCSCEKKDDAK